MLFLFIILSYISNLHIVKYSICCFGNQKTIIKAYVEKIKENISIKLG